ncbi:unnamed protein product [Brassica oleracea]
MCESCVRSEKDQMINSLPRIGKLLKIEDDSRVMASNILMFVDIYNIYVSSHFTRYPILFMFISVSFVFYRHLR